MDEAFKELRMNLSADRLKELAQEIKRREVELEELRQTRNDILVSCYGLVPVTKLAKLVGMTRERVSRIASAATIHDER